MNEVFQTRSGSDVPWPTGDNRMPATEGAVPAAVDSLNRVVQGAHAAVDRFADGAEPKVRQLSESVAAAGTALRAGADQLGQTRDKVAESVRATVRSHPLAAIAAALALGAVIVRVMRGSARPDGTS